MHIKTDLGLSGGVDVQPHALHDQEYNAFIIAVDTVNEKKKETSR